MKIARIEGPDTITASFGVSTELEAAFGNTVHNTYKKAYDSELNTADVIEILIDSLPDDLSPQQAFVLGFAAGKTDESIKLGIEKRTMTQELIKLLSSESGK